MIFNKKIFITIFAIIFFYSLFMMYADIQKIQYNFENININFLPIMISLLIFSIFIRSIIQKILLDQISVKLSIVENFKIFFSGLSMIFTPGGSGQLIKSYIIHKKYDHSIQKTLPLIFAERFLDLISITFVISITLIFHRSYESFSILFLSLFIIGFVFTLTRNEKYLNSFFQKLQKIPKIGKAIPDTTIFISSVHLLHKKIILLKTLCLLIPITFIDGLISYFGFLSFDLDIGYFHSIQLFYTSLLLGVFSLIPGGIGIMEASLTSLLIHQNISLPLSTSITLFVRLCTIWLAFFIGTIVLVFITRKSRE